MGANGSRHHDHGAGSDWLQRHTGNLYPYGDESPRVVPAKPAAGPPDRGSNKENHRPRLSLGAALCCVNPQTDSPSVPWRKRLWPRRKKVTRDRPPWRAGSACRVYSSTNTYTTSGGSVLHLGRQVCMSRFHGEARWQCTSWRGGRASLWSTELKLRHCVTVVAVGVAARHVVVVPCPPLLTSWHRCCMW